MVALYTSINGLFPARTYTENEITYRLMQDEYVSTEFYVSFPAIYRKWLDGGDTVLVRERNHYYMANKPHWGL